MRGRTATDDGAAARIHRGTYQGLLAARTELGGEVEVVGYATSSSVVRSHWAGFCRSTRGNSTKTPSPRMDPAESPTDLGRRN